MKKIISWTILISIIILIVFSIKSCSGEKKEEKKSRGTFLNTTESPYSVKEGVKRFEKILDDNALSLFHVIDHAQNAKNSDMELLPETVVVFGNPKMGTILMRCNPSIGMDLPLKMLFYTDYEGKNWISYTNPEYYTLKHNIKDKQCLDVIHKANIALQTLADETAKSTSNDNNTTKEQ